MAVRTLASASTQQASAQQPPPQRRSSQRLAAVPVSAHAESSRRVTQRLAGGHLALTSSARRALLLSLSAPPLAALLAVPSADAAKRDGYEFMPALSNSDFGKPRTVFPDFVMTESGLQYKDLREGTGATPKRGSRVTVDWDGYTIGYYGRVFQARNRAKGGAFSSEEDELLRWAVGSGACIPALDEAVLGMKVGGIRRIYVSPGPLFYPLGPNGAVTQAGRKLLPQPSTFSGQRSLYFVLENQGLVDKSLLFDLELKRVD